MKRRLGSGRISPPAGFEPGTRDPKSGALTARPRGRFMERQETKNAPTEIHTSDIHFSLNAFQHCRKKAGTNI